MDDAGPELAADPEGSTDAFVESAELIVDSAIESTAGPPGHSAIESIVGPPDEPGVEPVEPSAEAVERAATTGRGLRSVYQPIVDLGRLTVVGYESLTRFDPVDGRTFGPDRWFTVAHRLGLGPRLEARALDSALARRDDLPGNCFLTLNVDPDSLLDPLVLRTLTGRGRLAGVVVEITEHRPWHWRELGPAVDKIRMTGALLAVDDAGAGYAGLQQVLQLRPSFLKLDRALVEGIDGDEAKVALIEMLGLFANRIDAWVLAEGVETSGEARRLTELEVPLAQGYYFGRPDRWWPDLDPLVRRELARDRAGDRETLFPLVDPVAAIGVDDDARTWVERSEPWVPVVDGDGRPLGLVDADAAIAGELKGGLVTNVHSSPAEVANRLATAAAEPGRPVLVTDNAGRYLGLVPLRRLLTALGGGGMGGPGGQETITVP